MSHCPKAGWRCLPLHTIAQVQTGLAKGKNVAGDSVTLPYLRVANVQDGFLDLSEVKEIEVAQKDVDRYRLRKGDVLLTEGGDFDKLGRGHVWQDELPVCLHQNHVFAVRTDRCVLEPAYFAALAASPYGKRYFLSCAKKSTNLASINSTQLRAFPVLLPPLPEQRKIAEILGTWDEAIALTERLIEAKRRLKKGLMQQLLTGKRRFPEFVICDATRTTRYGSVPADWGYARIGEIAREISRRNRDCRDLPVLSCTKYDGLVESLSYFGRQVFGDDTSAYKIVRRNEYAYATNHIEEGSIGYQNLYEEALVSPMYTVFSTSDRVDDSYLLEVLKQNAYLHLYRSNTDGTVNRRGGLRWRAFAEIRVPIPALAEQRAIAASIEAAQEVISLLQMRLRLLRAQRKGLLQQLITGSVRVTL